MPASNSMTRIARPRSPLRARRKRSASNKLSKGKSYLIPIKKSKYGWKCLMYKNEPQSRFSRPHRTTQSCHKKQTDTSKHLLLKRG